MWSVDALAGRADKRRATARVRTLGRAWHGCLLAELVLAASTIAIDDRLLNVLALGLFLVNLGPWIFCRRWRKEWRRDWSAFDEREQHLLLRARSQVLIEIQLVAALLVAWVAGHGLSQGGYGHAEFRGAGPSLTSLGLGGMAPLQAGSV